MTVTFIDAILAIGIGILFFLIMRGRNQKGTTANDDCCESLREELRELQARYNKHIPELFSETKKINMALVAAGAAQKKQTKLTKEIQEVVKEKKIGKEKSKVALVLDISGSMRTGYTGGDDERIVQDIVEKILPVAIQLSSYETLDVWIFDDSFHRLPPITENDFHNYVQREIINNPDLNKFGGNNEPLVMEDIVKKYTVEDEDEEPVFVVFISDGGVGDGIGNAIIQSSMKPIFWQFIGIKSGDYGALKNLENLPEREINNAGFFEFDDFKKVSGKELYERLLSKYPNWLKEAKAKGIIS